MPRQKGWSDDEYRTRAEDIRFMAATGEHGQGAAARLGLTYDALEKWASKHTPDAWRTLAARNPRDPNYRSNQHTAA